MNFLSTADIIGGIPVARLSMRGELVGVIFDGNQDSLVLDIAYDKERARDISLVGAITESLDMSIPLKS